MEAVKIFLDTNIVLDYFTGRMGDGFTEKDDGGKLHSHRLAGKKRRPRLGG